MKRLSLEATIWKHELEKGKAMGTSARDIGRANRGEFDAGPIEFEGIGPCYFRNVRYGMPCYGDYYLSGNPVQAWRAPTNLIVQEYQIVVPTVRAKRVQVWQRGERVNV